MLARLLSPLSPTRNLRVRFALIMGASGLFFGVISTGYLEWRLEQTTQAAAYRTLKATAREIGGRVGSDLAARRREILLLGGLLQTSRFPDMNEVRALLDELKKQQPSYAWIGLIDTSGKVLAATGGLLEQKDVSARPWFSGALNGVYLDDPHEAKLLAEHIGLAPDGEPARFVDVAIPLKDAQGRFKGVLAAHLHWYWVQMVIASTLNDLEGELPIEVLVADRQGRFLLKPSSETASSLADLVKVNAQDERFVLAQALAEASDLSAGLGWTVVARQEARLALMPVQDARNLMFLLSLGVGLVFVWLSWRLAGRIAGPIAALADEARSYRPAAGQVFKSAVAARADEVGTLAKVIGELVANLQVHAGRTKLFIEHAPVSLAIFDTDMRYVAVSRRWLLDYGLEGRELIGRSHYDVFPEIPPYWREIHQRALGGEVLSADCEPFERPDGSRQWLRWELRPWRALDGTTGGVVLFSEVITERIEAESRLRDSEEKFRVAFASAAIGFALRRPDGSFADANQAFCQLTGYTIDELQGLDYRQLIHPECLAQAQALAAQMYDGQIPCFVTECRYVRKDQTTLWVRTSVSLVRDARGAPQWVMALVEDISIRKEAEETLQASQELLERYNADLNREVAERTRELVAARNYFRDFVLRAPLALSVVDAEGRIAIRNEQFIRLFGYDEAAVPTMAAWWPLAYPDPDYRARVQQTWDAAVRQAQAEHRAITPIEYRVTCGDGLQRDVEIAGITLEAGFLATFVDVTERRQVERELRIRREEADSANQAKSDFLATMSHEIRTPMNAILGTAQILERAALPAEERQLVSSIRTAGRSLLALINDVLDLSKIEAGHFELEHSPFVLSNIMSALIDVYSPSARNKGLELSLSALPEEVEVLIGDAGRVGQVLHNLLGNAIKFTAQGQISVSVSVLEAAADRACLRFSVRDTGIGIAAERLGGLFEAFVQADTTTSRQFGGTGLGLAICRQLVTLMGGDIGADSQPGVGSEFWFTVTFERGAGSQSAVSTLPAPASGPRLAGLHLLIVDDSAVNLKLAQHLLALEAASCEIALDGLQALACLRDHAQDFDLVLMDIQMPGMDGLETTQVIRGELGLRDLPVIALTAGALPSQRERALGAGMDGFIVKPFELDVLVAVILRHVGRPQVFPGTKGKFSPALPPPGDFPLIPGIDSHRAAQRMLGDRALFFSSLRALRQEFADTPALTRADLASGERQAAARRLHKLRGIAGNVSAVTLAALAGELEQALATDADAQWAPRLEALAFALDEVLSGLPAEIEESREVAGESAEVDRQEVQALIEALAGNDMKALRSYEVLRPRLVARHGEEQIRLLSEAIEQLNFDEARSLLQTCYP